LADNRAADERLILVTGATGAVGGRLAKALEMFGHRLRCLARRPERLRPLLRDSTAVVQGDVLDIESLRNAMQGVHTAYYLVHSMASAGPFEEEDRRAAENFAQAARETGVQRIIYLGALAHGPHLSRHLTSRQEVGSILRESGVQTIEFRASIIIGANSVSFEFIRALIEKLPLIPAPRWVRTLSQPIGIHDVIYFLLGALDRQTKHNEIFEIGGACPVSYLDLMKEYARQRRLKRLMVPIPVLTLRLTSLWLALLTPAQARVGRKLIEGLRNETVVWESGAREAFGVEPKGMPEAIRHELETEDRTFAEARWGDLMAAAEKKTGWGGVKFGARLVDSRAVEVSLPPERAFAPIRRIGGHRRWYHANWLWNARGMIDKVLGGVGMWRGRRDPEELQVGDVVDCWRVEAFEPHRLLRLVADMKMPGRGWLQFEVEPTARGATIRQTAIFDPRGLSGLIYWYGLYPIHGHVFAGMVRAIAREAARP
jgi:uncharacterized protein YbjT (DUF2867 family)